jgi:hypothetical protein
MASEPQSWSLETEDKPHLTGGGAD